MTDTEIIVDPLKRANYELTLRKVRREDLGMAISERQLITEDEHRAVLAKTISSVVTFLDTLPDRLERTGGISGHKVQELRGQMDALRDEIYESLVALEKEHKQFRINTSQIAPVNAEGKTATQVKERRKRGRPTNAERAARMSLS